VKGGFIMTDEKDNTYFEFKTSRLTCIIKDGKKAIRVQDYQNHPKSKRLCMGPKLVINDKNDAFNFLMTMYRALQELFEEDKDDDLDA
jgi:hypothetical protein